MSEHEYFPGIKKIEFEGAESKNFHAYHYYNPNEVILGKKMSEWLRFSVCYWHSWRGNGQDMFGGPTLFKPYDDSNNPSVLEAAKKRLDAHFEFLHKLGVEYWCFHDRDLVSEGKNLEETNHLLDEAVTYAKHKQDALGLKCLWGTANLFSHHRYQNGAATNPDAHAFAHAAAQVKKAMDVSHRLGAENYVFWGGREGYQTLLNTNLRRELDHQATFLRYANDYKKHIGFNAQLLIEPKPREPTKHQYDFDSATVIGFLKTYNLIQDFKLNIESNHATLAGHTFEHELAFASAYGALGSVDANMGDTLLGWDVDLFPTDVKSATLAMKVIIGQNGLGSGGLNFDAKIRRESTDPEDLFIAHINGIDTFARGLRNAARIIEEGTYDKLVHDRYSSYYSGIGHEIESGKSNFQDLEKFIIDHGEPKQVSGKQEKYENIINRFT